MQLCICIGINSVENKFLQQINMCRLDYFYGVVYGWSGQLASMWMYHIFWTLRHSIKD